MKEKMQMRNLQQILGINSAYSWEWWNKDHQNILCKLVVFLAVLIEAYLTVMFFFTAVYILSFYSGAYVFHLFNDRTLCLFKQNIFSILDINECSLGNDLCDRNADCTNTIGNYTCVCRNGYSGNGFTCIGKNSFYG